MPNRRNLISAGAATLVLAACRTQNTVKPAASIGDQVALDPLAAALAALAANARFSPVLANPGQFRLQAMLSWPTATVWKTAKFRAGAEWNAPASMVKLPLAVLTLRALAERELALSTELRIVNPPECAADVAQLREFEPISRSLERMLIVSDNGAFNRLLEFVGMQRVNTELVRHGFGEALIQARLGSCTPVDNARGRDFELKQFTGIYAGMPSSEVQRSHHTPRPPSHGQNVQIGNAYLDFAEQRVEGPRDFSLSNHFSITDSHRILCNLADPVAFPEPLLDSLSAAHRRYLLQILRTLPRQAMPPYAELDYPDSYGKFLLWGDRFEQMPENVQIANKIGEAYGFLHDSAWITQSGPLPINCVLSASIYVNADGVLNDNKYEYETLGIPLLAELGRQVAAALSSRNQG
jgi:beta-lactamase class A